MLTYIPSAAAQGSRADYERAAKLEQRWKDKVLNETLEPVWLSEQQFIYRRQIDLEHWEYVQVDAETGTKTPAFDHTQLAQNLSAALGKTIDPQRLPFSRLGVQENQLIVSIDNDRRFFGIDLGATTKIFTIEQTTGQLSELPLEQATAFRLKRLRANRSRSGRSETMLMFINHTDVTVELQWIDTAGEAHTYGTLQPGQQRQQHTYAGHLWRVRDNAERVLGDFIATETPGLVVIDFDEPWPERQNWQRLQELRRTSPNDQWVVIFRNNNVYLREVTSQQEVALTTNGSSEDAYTHRFSWSPDSNYLVVMRTKPEQTHEIHMIESSPSDQVEPKLHSMQYLKPGDRIAHPRPYLFDIQQRQSIPIDDVLFPNPWSIDRLEWLPDSSAFVFLYNQRGHQIMRVIAVDAASGKTRTVIEERSKTFIDYSNKTYFQLLADANEAIWMSERSGFNHLYLVDLATGKVKHTITHGDWLVRDVVRIDEETHQIWFRAMGVYPDQDPYHVHFGRVNFDGGNLTWLTAGDGMHTLQYSPEQTYYVDTYSRMDQPPIRELRRTADGALICELERADWSPLIATGWSVPERFVAKGRDGQTDIWGLIYAPTNFDPNQRYPVIENIYAGPQDHFVPKSFMAYTRSRQIAELGFIVVRIDGMGTNWRSKPFHDVCWKNLGDAGFPDRIAWLKAAAQTRPYMDLTRVGIFGGSAGGQNALRALLAHGDFYHAAVADCGCHDNRMDKIWWNEAWMGWPVGPEYAAQSNVTQAHKLQGDLLLMVGELDRNVDPASTTQVVDALIKADKDFEFLLIPGAGHGVIATHPYAERRMQDFFVRKLLKVEPRWSDTSTPSEN